MRVLLIGDSRSPHLVKWGRALKGSGLDVHVASWTPSVIEDVPTWVLPHGPMRIPKTTLLAAWAALARLLGRLRPDVVHCHSVMAVDLACYLTRAPVVVSPWGAEIQDRGRRSWAASARIRLVLRRASRVVVTAASMGDELVRRFGVPRDKVELLSWGVNYGLFGRLDAEQAAATRRQLGIPPDAIVLLNNRYFPVVDPDLLLGAFERVAGRRPDVALVLIQGYTHEQHWEAAVQAAARRQDGRIKLVPGPQAPAEMCRYVQAADIFVNVPYRDQLSTSLLEAMAAGLLPVISDLPAYRCLAQDGAELIAVKPLDVASLERALEAAIDRLPEFRQGGQAINRRLVERSHNWPRQVTKMIELYTTLTRTKAPDGAQAE